MSLILLSGAMTPETEATLLPNLFGQLTYRIVKRTAIRLAIFSQYQFGSKSNWKLIETKFALYV